uniref:hypothetical protein n=1 Tax=Microbacterium proteolyticum TaxID=1572644 RepID=UPI0024166CB1|nr:hypothetical protein [Microbacterium proteolyticum]
MSDAAAIIGELSDLLGAVAWPLVAVFLAIYFRKDTSRALRAIRKRILSSQELSLQIGALRAAANGFIEQAAIASRDVILRASPPASPIVIEEATKALAPAEAAAEPVEQVRLAREAVSERLRVLLADHGAPANDLSLDALAIEARRLGLISPEVEASIRQLSTLAGVVSGSGATAPNQRAAKAFSSLAKAVLQTMPTPD